MERAIDGESDRWRERGEVEREMEREVERKGDGGRWRGMEMERERKEGREEITTKKLFHHDSQFVVPWRCAL